MSKGTYPPMPFPSTNPQPVRTSDLHTITADTPITVAGLNRLIAECQEIGDFEQAAYLHKLSIIKIRRGRGLSDEPSAEELQAKAKAQNRRANRPTSHQRRMAKAAAGQKVQAVLTQTPTVSAEAGTELGKLYADLDRLTDRSSSEARRIRRQIRKLLKA